MEGSHEDEFFFWWETIQRTTLKKILKKFSIFFQKLFQKQICFTHCGLFLAGLCKQIPEDLPVFCSKKINGRMGEVFLQFFQRIYCKKTFFRTQKCFVRFVPNAHSALFLVMPFLLDSSLLGYSLLDIVFLILSWIIIQLVIIII